MTYKELLARVNLDFNIQLSIYKEKAGYLMLSPNGTLGNWDCGHSCPSRTPYIELPNGWGYALLENTWHRLPDGIVGWRGKEEPSPFERSLPDAPADFSPFR